MGRYSFLAVDPFDYLELPVEGKGDCLAELSRRIAGLQSETAPGLPPFQGGAAGVLGYELGRQLERLPAAVIDEFQFPAIAVGFYDVVIAWDHVQNGCWIISQGLPEVEPQSRRRHAAERLAEVRGWLDNQHLASGDHTGGKRHSTRPPVCSPGAKYAVGSRRDLLSNFSAAGYLEAVRRVIEYIVAGDVFQVNLSQRLLYPAQDDSVSLYLRLRRCNPAPFAGYFDLGDFQIVSASPERFLRLSDGRVETRPIKGTRPRSACSPGFSRLIPPGTSGPAGRGTTNPTSLRSDDAAERELLESQKDRAENVMIVDLLRNDLSRVCQPESVLVTQLCQVETYQYVKHLVSAVEGTLREGRDAIDLLRAAFPGGSVTGTPKVRAMEIITELEPTARGAYCGSLGYLGFDGSMDLNILIRTITAGRGWWQIPVGGGIVAQSDPQQEYEETWHKAEGMLRALE